MAKLMSLKSKRATVALLMTTGLGEQNAVASWSWDGEKIVSEILDSSISPDFLEEMKKEGVWDPIGRRQVLQSEGLAFLEVLRNVFDNAYLRATELKWVD